MGGAVQSSSRGRIDQTQADQVAQWRQMMARMAVMMLAGRIANAGRRKQTDQAWWAIVFFCLEPYCVWPVQKKKNDISRVCVCVSILFCLWDNTHTAKERHKFGKETGEGKGRNKRKTHEKKFATEMYQ